MRFPLLLAIGRATFALTLLAVANPLLAAETQFWTNDSARDFDQAKLTQLALRSDGRLSLAPMTQEWFDPSVSYLWAVTRNRKGQVFLGGGNPGSSTAKIFVVDGEGKGKVLAEVPGLQVQALAVDGKDRLFAATAPDSKIYLIENGKATVFFDPQVKYVWAMAFAPTGELYLGTGNGGRIFRVDAGGKGQELIKLEDDHVRSLALDGKGNLVAGTEPSGLIVRVNLTGAARGFVLHQSDRREVTAIAIGADGTVFAAATGARQATAQPSSAPPPMAPPAAGGAGASAAAVSVAASGPVSALPITAASATFPGGSEVLRIDAMGYPQRIWSDASEIAYALALDAAGNPLVATGNKGGIYRLEKEGASLLSTRIASLAPTQVTALHMASDGKLFAVTGNVGKLYRLGPEEATTGTLESDVFDAGWLSHWGRISPVFADKASAASAKWETRSGNLSRPGPLWSEWALAKENIASPAARFLQYRLTLTKGTGSAPEVISTEIAYLTRNVAPIVERIELLEPNYRFLSSNLTITPSANINIPPMRGGAAQPSISTAMRTTTDPGSATLNFAKGFQSARWMAGDPNGDTLRYKVELRARGEANWKLLKDQLTSANFTFESAAFADGEYQLRVTANDALGNPAGAGLTQALASDFFAIDNTAPTIEGLAGRVEGQYHVITWTASDRASILSKAEYSINGQDWQLVEPKAKLSDAKRLEYELTVPRGNGDEVTLAVRVADYADNVAVERLNLK